jgi:hypothetical protein
MTSSGKILAGDCHGKLFQHADDACVIFEMNQEVARLEIFQKAQPAAHAFLSRPKRSERRETQASARQRPELLTKEKHWMPAYAGLSGWGEMLPQLRSFPRKLESRRGDGSSRLLTYIPEYRTI